VISILVAALLATDPQPGATAPPQRPAPVSPAELAERGRQMQEDLAACQKLEREPMTVEKEMEVGAPLSESFRQKHGPPLMGPLADYVQTVGEAVAKGAQRQELKWTFEVLEGAAPKSGHAPGGVVLVTTGLLAGLKNEAQLAFVLGHEIAHLDLDVPVKVKRAAVLACRSKMSMRVMGKDNPPKEAQGMDQAMAATMERQTFLIPLSMGPNTEDELTADAAAVTLLARAGYSALEARKLLESASWGSMFQNAMPPGPVRAGKLGAPKGKDGKKPPFPRALVWPKAEAQPGPPKGQ
jgi:beta-barrel assembly-enhancing protease